MSRDSANPAVIAIQRKYGKTELPDKHHAGRVIRDHMTALGQTPQDASRIVQHYDFSTVRPERESQTTKVQYIFGSQKAKWNPVEPNHSSRRQCRIALLSRRAQHPAEAGTSLSRPNLEVPETGLGATRTGLDPRLLAMFRQRPPRTQSRATGLGQHGCGAEQDGAGVAQSHQGYCR